MLRVESPHATRLFIQVYMIQIRPCGNEDFEGVVALLRQLWPDKHIDMAMLRVVYERALGSPMQHHICAVQDNIVVGMGSLSINNNLWREGYLGYIEELIVDERFRKQGIGTQLLEHLVSVAKNQGCRCVELDAAFQREEAHRFYEKRGFQPRAYLFSQTL